MEHSRSNGHNLIGVIGTCHRLTHGANGDLVGTSGLPINPQLGPLADNGASRKPHAPQTGSPTIDGGTNTGARPLISADSHDPKTETATRPT